MTSIRSRSTRAVLLSAGLATGAMTLLTAPSIRAAEGDKSLALEEVVVTARRKEESLQEVPVAVSVLTGDELLEQGGLKIDAIGKTIPNVHFEAAGGTSGVKSPEIFIRGMGQSDFIPVEDPAVGIYIDGVYMARNIGSVFDLIDVERIEVLRGPQGTLFGRNTIGGAVNIVSRAPTDEFGGSVSVAGGDDGYLELRGTINVPMGDRAAGRLSAFKRERDGYVKALQYDNLKLGDDNIWGARASFRVDFTENLSLSLAGDYSNAEETPSAITPVGAIGRFNGQNVVMANPTQNFATAYNNLYSGNAAACATISGQATNPACYGPVWSTGSMYKSNSVFVDNAGNKIKPEQGVEVWGGNATLTWQIGPVELKSITSYREFDIHLFNDLDFSPFILFANNHDEYTEEQRSQEFQISGNLFDDRVDYVLGYYYFDEKGREAIFNQITFLPPLSLPPDFFFQYLDRIIDNDSQAIFGQVNVRLLDELTLTLGARYTESDKSFTMLTRRRVGPVLNQSGQLETKETTPLVSLTWNVTEDVMIYATYSEGYRDGSYAARFTGVVPDPLPNYDPEYVKNYEIGMKSTWLDGRMRLNLTLFNMDYSDMQISASSSAVATSSTKENLGDATLQGLELELSALVNEYLTVGVNLGVMDDQIDSLKGTLISNTIVISEDSDLPMTPDWTLALMAKFEYPLAAGHRLFFRADYTVKDDYYTRAENIPEALIDDYRSLNLSAGFLSADDHWDFTVGMRNATDESYYESVTPFITFGLAFGQPVRPRTTYATLTYRFGDN
ncbi:MAG: TonB-dependent receptor [Pseudomonadales bacterium]|nr:TonB-dependent receptor [Pseudomonadales bacterium]MCP5183108.1 TonB-dependent receptor [Pseudomonadales bacterium]